jgi:hypothetical protein
MTTLAALAQLTEQAWSSILDRPLASYTLDELNQILPVRWNVHLVGRSPYTPTGMLCQRFVFEQPTFH